MAKLETLPLNELYERKMTASVEAAILKREDFSKQVPNWCQKVCRLKCKNPPRGSSIVPTEHVDVLIIQDHQAFAEPKFRREAATVERTNKNVINYLARVAFRATADKPALTYSVTNLLKCQVQPEDVVKGKGPTDVTLMKCRPYLLEEIKRRNPKVIISLNTAVTKALGLKKTNYGNRGEIHEGVIFTLHPRTLLMLRQNSSGKFWGPDFYEVILRDFRKAARFVRGELRNPNLLEAIQRVKGQITIARSETQAHELCKLLVQKASEGYILSYDLETTGLDPWSPDAKILTAQFGYRDDDGKVQAIVFPLWHRENVWYEAKKVWPSISRILDDKDIPKVGHNIKFDVLYTYATTGCRVKGIQYDTMLLLHAKDSGTQGNLGLKQAVWDYLPHTELGGYEDLLPSLHSAKQIEKLEGEEVETE